MRCVQTWARAKIQLGESKIFQLGESNLKNFERGSHQNSTRGVGPFFAKKNFSSRGVKFNIFDRGSHQNSTRGVHCEHGFEIPILTILAPKCTKL